MYMQCFLPYLDSFPFAVSCITGRIIRIKPDSDPVSKISVSVGESPGNMTIGTSHDSWCSRETDSGDVNFLMNVREIRVSQAGTKPQIWDAQ